MLAHSLVVSNPLDPVGSRQMKQVSQPTTIKSLAPDTVLPFICLLNGRPIMRKDWGRIVEHDDIVVFSVLPQGDGGKSDPLRMILMIAVAMFAQWAAPQLAPAMGLGSGEFAIAAVKAGIGMIGSALVNALIPPPSPPTPAQSAQLAAPSPTYSLTAQGNAARLGAAIPVQYGRVKFFPDFASMPYTEYAGNEQYLYQLLCLGVGEYSVESINIEDTAISNFEEIEYQVVEPYTSPTLFPQNVITSAEVSGQELTNAGYTGPFTANPSNTDALYLGFDVVTPRGIYYANDQGGLDSVSITVRFQAREIDDSGTPIGSWVTLGTETITGATTTPQRRSYRYSMTAGRYEVQATRTDVKQTGSRYGHEVVWASVRAYLKETRDFGNVTLLAMRMRATNNLSQQASRLINVVATRKIRTWDSTNGWSATATANRSIAWAIADILSADYGGGLADSRISLAELETLDATWTARGDQFDGRFDGLMALWEGLQKIAQAGRARPYQQNSVVRVVRDEAVSIPVAFFSDRNIVRGSFSVEYMMPTEETADAVQVKYWDEDYWQQRKVLSQLDGGTANNTTELDLFGVVDRDHAHREGLYVAAANKYRRKVISFTTEMEGFIPSLGDKIIVSHDMPQWGQSGELTAVGTLGGGVDDWSIWNDATRSSSTAVCPDGSQTAYEITDDSITLYESIFSGSVGYTDGDIVAQTFWILKDATATHFCRFDIDFIGGTTVSELIRLDVTDGSYETSGAATLEGVIVEADGIWWKVSLSASSSGNSNTGYRFQFYPAVGATPFTEAVSATGTTTIWFPEVTLTGSEDFTFETNRVHYIGLRKKDGSVLGPFHAIAGATSKEVIITGLSDTDLLNVTGNWERTHYTFGWAETWRQEARVLQVLPKDDYRVEIIAINEDPSVHTADTGITAPAVQTSQLPTLYTYPTLVGLISRSQPDNPEMMLLSWEPTPGADHYLIEQSEDGTNWTRTGEVRTNTYTAIAIYGAATLVRVAAVGLTVGPWVTIGYGSSADYMWSATDTDLMWNADDTTLMWSY